MNIHQIKNQTTTSGGLVDYRPSLKAQESCGLPVASVRKGRRGLGGDRGLGERGYPPLVSMGFTVSSKRRFIAAYI